MRYALAKARGAAVVLMAPARSLAERRHARVSRRGTPHSLCGDHRPRRIRVALRRRMKKCGEELRALGDCDSTRTRRAPSDCYCVARSNCRDAFGYVRGKHKPAFPECRTAPRFQGTGV